MHEWSVVPASSGLPALLQGGALNLLHVSQFFSFFRILGAGPLIQSPGQVLTNTG